MLVWWITSWLAMKFSALSFFICFSVETYQPHQSYLELYIPCNAAGTKKKNNFLIKTFLLPSSFFFVHCLRWTLSAPARCSSFFFNVIDFCCFFFTVKLFQERLGDRGGWKHLRMFLLTLLHHLILFSLHVHAQIPLRNIKSI